MIGETLDDLPDDQRGVELESIWSEPGVLKELDELLDVSFKVNIGQVRHHVGHHLEKVLTITRGILDAP